MMDEQMRDIIALVARLGREITALTFVLKGRLVAVTPLGGGLTNLNFLLQIDGERYALRIAGEGTEILNIDRHREVACAESAAAAGVAPAVVHPDPKNRVLVTRFAPGKGLKVDDLRRPDVMERVVRAVRRMHEQPVTQEHGSFSAFRTVSDYLQKARGRHEPGEHPELPPELSDALGLLNRLEKELRTDEPPCLCHNDLLAGNFLDDGSAVQIIDWEYGGAGDRFFDLGNFAVNHELNEDEERAFLACYFGTDPNEQQMRRLKRMRLVSDMREAMWGFLQARVSTIHPPQYYHDYGVRHLDRFLAGCNALGV